MHDTVYIVKMDSRIADVTPLILYFIRITYFYSNPNEEIDVFVSHFRRLDTTYLENASISPLSQMGQFIAIYILNNGNLDEKPLHSVKY